MSFVLLFHARIFFFFRRWLALTADIKIPKKRVRKYQRHIKTSFSHRFPSVLHSIHQKEKNRIFSRRFCCCFLFAHQIVECMVYIHLVYSSFAMLIFYPTSSLRILLFIFFYFLLCYLFVHLFTLAFVCSFLISFTSLDFQNPKDQ